MKKQLALCIFLALGSLHVFGTQSQSSQFSIQTPKQKAALQARTQAHAQAQSAVMPGRSSLMHGVLGKPNASAKTKLAKAHPHIPNPPASKIGFVSATQIPTGGGVYSPAIAGDFNGDGKQDIVSLVATDNNCNTLSTFSYCISVVLSNGDGTFQNAKLTGDLNGNGNDQVLVGDVNGDGKQDLIVVHSQAPSTFEVWLGNEDGTFNVGNNVLNPISTNNLNGGVMADVNGDGKLDLVAIDNQNPPSILTVTGNGDGTFSQTPASAVLSGGNLSNIVFADFNGDGVLDFAASDSNYNNQTVIYLAQSGGKFVPGIALSTAEHDYGTCSNVAGDLNGDGKPEIVTVNCQNDIDNLTVYVNNGDGTFQNGVYYASANANGTTADLYPRAVTIADVNGDGKNDIISSNDYGGDVTILLGNGDGTVKVPTVGYGTGGYPWTPALVGDFNGDGLADIIVADNEFSFAYLQGYGDGSFRAAVDYYAPIPDDYWAYGITIASGDLNGDGYPDFVVGNGEYNPNGPAAVGITVFLSRSDGSLKPGVNYGSGGNLTSVVVADFNGDKNLDIAAVDSANNVVDIFQGKGDGTFTLTAGSPFGTGGSNAQSIVSGDFNKDGLPDLAIVNWNSQNVSVLLNDGTGGFQTPVPNSVPGYGQAIAAADLNGDGNLDLVVPQYNGAGVAVLLGNPDGTFQPANTSPFAFNNVDGLALGDLDGDGKLDLAVTVDDWPTGIGVAIAQGNGDGTFQPVTLGSLSFYSTTQQDLNMNTPYPRDVKILDLDGDGHLDLIYTNTDYSTVGVLYNIGTNPFVVGMFYDPVEYAVGAYPYGLALADVNKDGAIDVVAVSDDFAGVTVLLNNSGTGTQANFAVAADTNTATVAAGSPATYNLSLTGKNGYNGTVTFSCSGLPAKASCAFSPASVVANGNLPQSTALTITTTAATAYFVQPVRPNSKPSAPTFWASLSGLGVFGLVLAGDGKKRNRRQMAIVLGILLLVMMFSLVGCGGGSSSGGNGGGGGGGTPGTPAGSYTVTVTATGTGSSAPTHSMNLTLVVQ